MKFRKQSFYKENAPTSDKNIIPDSCPSQSSTRKPSPNVGNKLKSLFPPRPNLHNPLKKKLMSDVFCGSSSTAVKDKLIRIKSTGNQVDPSADGDEEMEIVDETEQATVPSNDDNKSNTPVERKGSADSDITIKEVVVSEQAINDKATGVDNPMKKKKKLISDSHHDSDVSSSSGTPIERKDSADSDIAMEGTVSGISPILKSPTPCVSPPVRAVQKLVIESGEQRFEMERARWNEAENKWIYLIEDLECELEASRLHVEKLKHELDKERKCSKELKDAMKLAMEGRARMLEQYADLEEKLINLLTSQRRIEDGIVDVKKAAAKAGVRNAESKFLNALAAETSTFKEEREKERLHYWDGNKGLQAQFRDTAEAVQAAGELLVRLKEAEEAVAAAEARAREAEQEKENAYKLIESLKRNDIAMYDDDKEPNTTSDDPQWRNEFENFYNEGELSNLAGPSSWSSGYDTCNI